MNHGMVQTSCQVIWQRTYKIWSSTGFHLRPPNVSDINKLLYGLTSTVLYADDTTVYDIQSNMQVLERISKIHLFGLINSAEKRHGNIGGNIYG